MTEKLNYEVLKSFSDFEVRRYPDHLLVQVEGVGEFNSASNKAFYPLFNYISGENAAQTKIAMTAPVFQEPVTSDKHVVSFVLPANVAPDQIPIPTNSKLTTKKVSAKEVAVMTFSGQWNESFLNGKAKQLLAGINRAGLTTSGPVYFARYDPPWKPWFLRRNGALVDLA